MRIYKSSLFVLGKNLVYAIGGGFVAALVLSWFLSSSVAIAGGLLCGLAVVYFTLYGDNITVAVDDNTMTVSRFGKVLHQFQLDESAFRANITTRSDMTGGDSDCMLTVTGGDGSETTIDCSMMGASRFHELLDDLGLTNPAPTALKTSKG